MMTLDDNDSSNDDDRRNRNDDDRRPERRSVWDIPASRGRAWLTIFSILSALGFVLAVRH